MGLVWKRASFEITVITFFIGNYVFTGDIVDEITVLPEWRGCITEYGVKVTQITVSPSIKSSNIEYRNIVRPLPTILRPDFQRERDNIL